MSNNNYKIGSWNVICDICGKKRKREQVRKTWDGFMACTVTPCWYPKHPNERPIPVINDGLPVKDARPRPTNVFITLPGINTWLVQITPLAINGQTVWTDPYLRWDDDYSNLPLSYFIR